MKILIKGYYGYGNLGDDILMMVSYRLIKKIYPSASVTIFSNNSENNNLFANEHEYNQYIKGILKEDIEIIDWSHKGTFDLVFHGGGGIYFDSNNDPSVWYYCLNYVINKLPTPVVIKFDSMMRRITNRSKNITALKRVGVGIGIGSYTKNSRRLFHELVEMGSYSRLVVRDQSSINFLENHGMPDSQILKNTDLAFINTWNQYNWSSHSKVDRVGIIVKDNLDTDLTKVLQELGSVLGKRGISCTYYSFDGNYDKESIDNYGSFNFVQYTPDHLEEFFELLRSEQLLFTTRAHGAILGGCLGIPSVILGIDVKLNEVAKMFKNSSICINKWDINLLIEAFDQISTNYLTVIDGLEKDISINRGLARKLEEVITNIL